MAKCISYLFLLLMLTISFPGLAQEDGEVFDTEIYEGNQNGDIDEDQQGSDTYFKTKEQPDKIAERSIDEEKILGIKKEDDYWYADLHPVKKKEKPKQKSFIQQDFVKTLFWILLIGGFVALLIWFLASGNINLFKKQNKAYKEEEEGQQEEEDIFALNYESDIQKAINAGNLRLAVRLLYLHTLKEMSERNIIKYSHEKTNSDYLFQLGKTRYYKSFFKLTRHFEYTWYGHFVLTAEAFQSVQNDFSSFKQQLN
jgi:hypothetical protein